MARCIDGTIISYLPTMSFFCSLPYLGFFPIHSILHSCIRIYIKRAGKVGLFRLNHVHVCLLYGHFATHHPGSQNPIRLALLSNTVLNLLFVDVEGFAQSGEYRPNCGSRRQSFGFGQLWITEGSLLHDPNPGVAWSSRGAENIAYLNSPRERFFQSRRIVHIGEPGLRNI